MSEPVERPGPEEWRRERAALWLSALARELAPDCWTFTLRVLDREVPARSRVNRLLKYARELGLKTVSIRFPTPEDLLADDEDWSDL